MSDKPWSREDANAWFASKGLDPEDPFVVKMLDLLHPRQRRNGGTPFKERHYACTFYNPFGVAEHHPDCKHAFEDDDMSAELDGKVVKVPDCPCNWCKGRP